ncbi:MAG: ion transporter [Bacteroidia bacterium]|nr:ion transporter [Bacteroidia bacterium]
MILIVEKIAHSRAFHITTMIVIISCAILLCVQTYPIGQRYLQIFLFLDWVYTLYFLVELIIRFIACGSVTKFYKIYEYHQVPKKNKKETKFIEEGIWNWLDTIIVLTSIISVFIVELFEHPETLAVVRLFRTFRILRILEVHGEMKKVEMKIIGIVPTIFSFGALLAALIIIYAVIGVSMFQQHKYENADFSNLHTATLTLFQCMTLDSWTEIMHQSTNQNYQYPTWFIRGYFVSFILLTAIISFNVFVAILTSRVQEKIEEENKKEEEVLEKYIIETQRLLRQEIQSLKAEVKKLREELQKDNQ